MSNAHPRTPTPPGCRVDVRLERDAHVIAIEGELDLAAADQVEDELVKAERSDAGQIVVDLSQLTFIDSTGIAILVAATNRSNANARRLRIKRSDAPGVRRVLEITGLEARLPFLD